MLLDQKQMLYNMMADQIIINHLDKKIKMDVVQPAEVGEKFKAALEKEGSLKELKSADWIIRFAEKIEAAPAPDSQEQTADTDAGENTEQPADNPDDAPETAPADDSKEEKSEDKPEEEQPAEDTDKQPEDNDMDSDEDKKKKEEVNESIKIQDLTKGMLSTPKAKKMPGSTAASPKANKTEVKETETGKSTAKKAAPKKEVKKPVEASDKKEVKEAETTVSGDELKVRVAKAVSKVFDIDKDEVDLTDVPGCLDGYNVYYCKLTFKDHEGQTQEEPKA